MANSDNTTQEIWKPIAEWEGIYEVSNMGRVRRIQAARGSRAGNVLGGRVDGRSGYINVRLSTPQRKIQADIHVLVAAAFVGPRPEGLCVNHKDGVKTNNQAANLEYLSRGDNIRHAAQVGLLPRGTNRPNAKLTDDAVREIRRRLAAGEKGRTLAKEFGVDPMQISYVKRGITWGHVK